MSVSSLVAKVASTRVTSGRQMAVFAGNVYKAVTAERGAAISDTSALQSWQNWRSQAKRVPKKRVARTLAPMFAKLRDWASAQGAPKTAAAVVQAASWFWKNVEQPRQAPSGGGFIPSGVSAALTPPVPGAPKLPLTQQVWFWPAVIGAGGLLLVGLILAMPGKEK